MNRFDGIGFVNDFADFRWIVEERCDARPIAPPGQADRQVVLVPLGFVLGEHKLGLFDGRSAVDALQIGGHLLAPMRFRPRSLILTDPPQIGAAPG